jgi:hypothetical protein
VNTKDDVFAKNHKMAKQKIRPTRPGGFSEAKAYMWYVEVLKKRRNAVGRTFCDAIKDEFILLLSCAARSSLAQRVSIPAKVVFMPPD